MVLDITLKTDAATMLWQQRMLAEQRETNALLRILVTQGARIMTALDAVARIEGKVDEAVNLMAEASITLRELAALARQGGSLAEIEARLNAAADKLEASRADLRGAEDETDPTPDAPPGE